MAFFSAVIVAVAAFFLGSVPFGLLIAKTFCGIDPRLDGSRNVGATNVARLCGFKWGALTLLCDVLKGFLPVFLLFGSGLAYPAALAVICGHMFSVFLNYKGGKGVATTVGVFLALAPWTLVLAGLACIFIIWRTGFVSAGSLTLVSALPILFLVQGSWGNVWFSLLVAILVIHAHRENIRRLWRGEEKTWQPSKTNP
jgi:glycerol-3-phosphate acyltransferase PlsY